MSRTVIIRCDRCNKEVGGNYRTYRAHGYDLDKELELCDDCAQKFKDYIMNFIQPQHYKY